MPTRTTSLESSDMLLARATGCNKGVDLEFRLSSRVGLWLADLLRFVLGAFLARDEFKNVPTPIFNFPLLY